MSATGRLVELPSGKTAILRERISWGARCRIEDAGGLPAEVAAVYAQYADQGLSEEDLAKAVAPQLVPHMAAVGRFARAKQSAQVLAWVESWDVGEVTADALDDLDEDDARALIEAVEAREARAAKAHDSSPDGADDPDSPTPAAAPSSEPSPAAAALPVN